MKLVMIYVYLCKYLTIQFLGQTIWRQNHISEAMELESSASRHHENPAMTNGFEKQMGACFRRAWSS